jgi:hypothetical protein
LSYVNLRRNKKIICQETSQPWPPPAEMGRHLCRQKPWHVTYRWTHLVNRKMTTYVVLIMKLHRNKIEMRSGVVRTVRLSRNSLTPRLSYAACYGRIKYYYVFCVTFTPNPSELFPPGKKKGLSNACIF